MSTTKGSKQTPKNAAPPPATTDVKLDAAARKEDAKMRWLLVSLVSISDRSTARALQIDVWENQVVKDIVAEEFTFFPMTDTDPEALCYIKKYDVKDFPHVAILDPRTKTLMWQLDHADMPSRTTYKRSAAHFVRSALDFLAKHSLKDPPTAPRYNVAVPRTDATLNAAARKAVEERRWLLVSLVFVSDHSTTHSLQVDVWGSQLVNDIVAEKFIFLPMTASDLEAQCYIKKYKVKDFPHVAILDPRTKSVMWQLEGWTHETNPLTAAYFVETALNFVTEHSLEDPPTASPFSLWWFFTPPTRLIHKATTFDHLREMTAGSSRWIIANIQREDDFMSHALNRDVWRHPVIQSIVLEGFVLWQTMDWTGGGHSYVEQYGVTSFPHLAIISAVTGEILWREEGWTDKNRLTAESFVETVMSLPERKLHRRRTGSTRDSAASTVTANEDASSSSSNSWECLSLCDAWEKLSVTDNFVADGQVEDWEILDAPSHLLHSAESFADVLRDARGCGRWLLVNIQSADEVSCSALNLDILRDDRVQNLVSDRFFLWQKRDVVPEAKAYIKRYQVSRFPHVSVIDAGSEAILWKKEGWAWTEDQPWSADSFVAVLEGIVEGREVCQGSMAVALAKMESQSKEYQSLLSFPITTPAPTVFSPPEPIRADEAPLWQRGGYRYESFQDASAWSEEATKNPWTPWDPLERDVDSTLRPVKDCVTWRTECSSLPSREEAVEVSYLSPHWNTATASNRNAKLPYRADPAALCSLLSFEEAAGRAARDTLWLLVVLSDSDHIEYKMDEIRNKFFVWKVSANGPAAIAYRMCHRVAQTPYFAVVDPRNHEVMWSTYVSPFRAGTIEAASLDVYRSHSFIQDPKPAPVSIRGMTTNVARLSHSARDFEELCNVGRNTQRWLLVSIQRRSGLLSSHLDREVWSNKAIESLILEGFIFWQTWPFTVGGHKYISKFDVKGYPHVAIIDPTTEHVVWRCEGWTEESRLAASVLTEAIVSLPDHKKPNSELFATEVRNARSLDVLESPKTGDSGKHRTISTARVEEGIPTIKRLKTAHMKPRVEGPQSRDGECGTCVDPRELPSVIDGVGILNSDMAREEQVQERGETTVLGQEPACQGPEGQHLSFEALVNTAHNTSISHTDDVKSLDSVDEHDWVDLLGCDRGE